VYNLANFDEKYNEYLSCINDELGKFCDSLNCQPKILNDSLTYSLQIGGKRVRPVLMFAVGDILGVNRNKLIPYALALEIIHTYSLIHDDLPEMDNDDFRRGKPSNHKVFGTANAVLAGDGLLNTAYSILFGECEKGSEYIAAAKYICDCAGVYGMIAGQSADLLHENDTKVDENALNFIYKNKTSRLITAALVVPAILNGGKYYSELKELGNKIGYMFQMTDDILDVVGDFEKLGKSIGKDAKEGKYTSVRLYGIENCKLRVDLVGDDCDKIIDGIDGDTWFLYDFITYLKGRMG
jgi:geranylgeranyl diphosphate synthase type II